LSLCSRNGPEEPGCSASDFPDVPRFWRDYVLSGQGVICHIRELIRCDLFELADTRQPSGERPPDVGTLPTKCMPTHFGDIMNPRTTSISLPSGFTPTERLLLTANGNVERIVSSYYNMPVTLYVMLNHQRNPAVYDRQVAMMMNGKQFLLAKTTVYITDPQWLHAVEHERVPVGSLFRHMGVMPTFTLHTACRGIGYYWRVYQLQAAGMTCEINETVSDEILSEKVISAVEISEKESNGAAYGF